MFIDTSGFYALLAGQDNQHRNARDILHGAARDKSQFITTDYVLDETATLLRARGLEHLIDPFFDIVFASRACCIVWMDEDRFLKTRSFFIKHSDHEWSFTDCASFIVMKEMKLSLALTKDKHYQEAGFTALLI